MRIVISLPESEEVSLLVRDGATDLVRTLAHGTLAAGKHVYDWIPNEQEVRHAKHHWFYSLEHEDRVILQGWLPIVP